MAVTTVRTILQNPARKRKPMAKRMTLKQRLHFGSARQRAAAKASLRGSQKRKAARPTHSHRARTRPKRKHNPGEIIAMTLGNPARKKGTKRMAHTKPRRRPKAHRAPRRQNRSRPRRHNPARPYQVKHHRVKHHRPRRHNPSKMLGGFGISDIFMLGGGAVVGSAGSSAIPQWLMGASNTGAMGYVGNFVATLILTWVSGMPKGIPRSFQAGVLAGGIGALFRRIISDYSLVGPFGAQLGLGDYMVSNWVTPQRVIDGWNSAQVYGQNPPGNVIPISSSGASYDDTLGLNDVGKAAGIC